MKKRLTACLTAICMMATVLSPVAGTTADEALQATPSEAAPAVTQEAAPVHEESTPVVEATPVQEESTPVVEATPAKEETSAQEATPVKEAEPTPAKEEAPAQQESSEPAADYQEETSEPDVQPEPQPGDEKPVVPATDEPAKDDAPTTDEPTEAPASTPTVEPEATSAPSSEPTAAPSIEPTAEPSVEPTVEPTVEPSAEPTVEPTMEPVEDVPVEELIVQIGLNKSYVFAGEGSVTVSAAFAGGLAPYSVTLQVNDADAEQRTMIEEAGTQTFNYAPAEYGVHAFKVIVTDSLGTSVSAGAELPVAIRVDVERRADWEKTFRNVELTGDWREDLIAIAETQIGYHESERNFIIDEDGKQQGYTRYGEWYGSSYADWCAMFVSFCLNYAEIPAKYFPREANCAKWKSALKYVGAYEDDERSYEPQPGDLVFFNYEDENVPQHVGIVVSVNADTMETIEGNSRKAVRRNSYELNDEVIVGYANVEALMRRAEEMLQPTPTPAPVTVPEISENGVRGVTTKSSVNMRSEADTDSDRVTQIKNAGTEVLVLGAMESEGALWYQVQYDGMNGYIRGDLLSVETQAETEETPAATAEPEATVEPEGTEEPEATAEPAETPAMADEKPTATPEPDVYFDFEQDVDFVFGENNSEDATNENEGMNPAEEPIDSEITILPAVTDEPLIDIQPVVTDELLNNQEEDVDFVFGQDETDESADDPCACHDATGNRLCEADCACECHAGEEPSDEQEPAEADLEYTPWSPRMAETTMHCTADGAVSYSWQRSLDSENWEEIISDERGDLLMSVAMDDLNYSYRCVAALADGTQSVSETFTLIDEALVDWLKSGDVTEDMLERAMNARSLESVVIEGDKLVYVRTGKGIALYDAETNAMIDLETGEVIGFVINGVVYLPNR